MVTTIIPVFNRASMIADCVESVIKQSYRPIQIILVDDGSTDSTPKVLEGLQQQFSCIDIVSQENAGPGAARNAGLKISRGEFIQYLDSDDRLHAEKFKHQVRTLQDNPNAGVCYCVTVRQDSRGGNPRIWRRTGQIIESLFPSFLPERGWATLSPLWRHSACTAIGPWKPYRMMEDWEHDVRAGLCGVLPCWVNQQLCTVIDHDGERASAMNVGLNRSRVCDLFRSHQSVWSEMKSTGNTDWAYVERFSRTMFYIGRLCGERGLIEQANEALDLADEMCQLNDQPLSTVNFRRFKSILGWRLTTKTAELVRSKLRQAI
ncbi:glycosyltransferase family 2 protein [Stieleria sp. JC731]|uniref:glycosyltransferase family 2 protein n=1 Tax=Pirellulaceae TaxID=2691357 RepID=UPI001E2C314F|nr:glycosyltransferase family A protein [Stieleria sp. JC731]MCC9601228.1 glycosyltransferase family 2 protein [Stieleria sp. JC731]